MEVDVGDDDGDVIINPIDIAEEGNQVPAQKQKARNAADLGDEAK